MVAFDYAKSAVTANRLITRFGRSAVLSRAVPGSGPAYDPGATTWTDYNVTLVSLPASSSLLKAMDDRVKAGTLVVDKLRSIILSPKATDGTLLPIDPQTGDRLYFDNYHWTVLSSSPLNPAGTAVLYNLGCERA